MGAKRVIEELEHEGMRARFTSITHMRSVHDDIAALLNDGSLDRELYEEYLSGYDYRIPDTFLEARSIVVAAVPSLPMKVTFHRYGEVYETLVPPTYAHAKEVDERVLRVMSRVAPDARFLRTYLPLKTLAARTGLVLYGRNNIGYVLDNGSFHRLTAFLSDIEVEEDRWTEKGMLPACHTCRKCLEACPNQVISEDRFLVQAKRCLTYQNEQPSDRPFPEWVREDAHNALVGCMTCQRVCPYDRKVLGSLEDGESFSEEETDCLLGGSRDAFIGAEVDRKLAKVGMDRSVFPRNLEVLIALR